MTSSPVRSNEDGCSSARGGRRAVRAATLTSTDAFYGLAGDFVRCVDPHTEADPRALLFQFLAAFGNAAGKGAFLRREADHHGLNLFVLLVGPTSSGRKGTAFSRVRHLMAGLDPGWARENVRQGLTSGEGLIHTVRDPIVEREPVRSGQRVVDYQTVVKDHGVEDKRFLAYEPEFARALRVMVRDGNTLSATLRQAWDGTDLRILTRVSPIVASNAHISVIGHITSEELARYCDRTELANGFVNRFLIVAVRRSKFLPHGGDVDPPGLTSIVRSVGESLRFAHTVGELRLSAEARQYWERCYRELVVDRPGLLGAATSRAEAQTLRLASVTAVLDRSVEIKPVHLRAARAMWDFAEESAQAVFGFATGDSDLEKVMEGLTASPSTCLDRTAVRNLFSRNRSESAITRVRDALVARNLIRVERQDSGGRPREVWRLVPGTTETTNPALCVDEHGVAPVRSFMSCPVQEQSVGTDFEELEL